MQTRLSIDESVQHIKRRLQEKRAAITGLLSDIVAIPTVDGNLRQLSERLLPEMDKLDVDEARLDIAGNIVGRVGKGSRILVFDTHLDTVGLGDAEAWTHDPFRGKLEGDTLFARGAGDGKGVAAAMLHALALVKELGLGEDYSVYFLGSVAAPCEGHGANIQYEVEGIHPDFVVLGSPTRMRVGRGQRGRQEFKAVSRGKTSSAGMPWNGHNALYDMCTYVSQIAGYNATLPQDTFLGSATCAVSTVICDTPSSHSIPGRATAIIDRRLLPSESEEETMAQLKRLAGADHVELCRISHDTPSWNGYSFMMEKSFPAWILAENHPLVDAAQRTRETLGRAPDATARIDLSTSGAFWMGRKSVPSIAFGPGDPMNAHTLADQISLQDVVDATGFYALLPVVLSQA